MIGICLICGQVSPIDGDIPLNSGPDVKSKLRCGNNTAINGQRPNRQAHAAALGKSVKRRNAGTRVNDYDRAKTVQSG